MDALLTFESKIRKASFKDFELRPDPYPYSEKAWEDFIAPPELEVAVKEIQDLMISTVKRQYKFLTKYTFTEASDLVYYEIVDDLYKAAGRYRVNDVASREAIISQLDSFFKKVCTGKFLS